MGSSFSDYLNQLELMLFFSGYPFVYLIIIFIYGYRKINRTSSLKIKSFLALSYAFVGTLYLAMRLYNNLFAPHYTKIEEMSNYSFLSIWGILSTLFWIPFFNKRFYLSLIHSLVFFLFLLKDLLYEALKISDNFDVIRNDMNIYSLSILLNFISFLFILLLVKLFSRNKRIFRL